MTPTIALGWWIAPALLTMAFLSGTLILGRRVASLNGVVTVAGVSPGMLAFAMAMILSLIAWLFWALL
ncbi:hypothetical protein EN829_014850 [Mesorhizobium sp. M00.F.Ca.ET.186.01.1.1]|nr:hypothetical protein EN848_14585 [bacterium M00.F.Ca.ET.205.01.1.1]TGU52962.1 hypothetical protein EN795_14810 [bacterium M00.F.Ca.ET.152.01.1.1]TGV35932.1 hypothetical protein EN829_014850 [Mesorhizobium sp. M00.F.Ca.ET.186.01.1.1]TGZ43514.1 hypothetical protein EN805_10420 [bacterium M00.F.Ca.ET.162.01.1.1]